MSGVRDPPTFRFPIVIGWQQTGCGVCKSSTPTVALSQSHIQSSGPQPYRRRQPQDTLLYKIVQEHFTSFLDELSRSDQHLPRYVLKEFEDYLNCGILQKGFLRVSCEECKHELLLALSCKGRGFCPSCGGRRLAQTSILLMDHILPEKPYRQWVITFPYQIRLLLATKPELISVVLKIVNSSIHTFLAKKLNINKTGSLHGVVTLIQRFGSSLNLNSHGHLLALDGLYRKHDLKFLTAPPFTDSEIESFTKIIADKILQCLTKTGYLTQDDDGTMLLDSLIGVRGFL